jgi:hypothetical protein
MIVEKFGSEDRKEVDDPTDYKGCLYCYAASKTCMFYRVGDTHFLRVNNQLREVSCIDKGRGQLALSCRRVTEDEARKLINEFAYN